MQYNAGMGGYVHDGEINDYDNPKVQVSNDNKFLYSIKYSKLEMNQVNLIMMKKQTMVHTLLNIDLQLSLKIMLDTMENGLQEKM